MSKKEETKKPVNTGELLEKPNGRFKKGFDPRRNTKGQPPGYLHYKTARKRLMERVAKDLNIKPEDVDYKIFKKAVEQMLRGNFHYYKDDMDRTYGKAIETFKVEGGDEPLKVEVSRAMKLAEKFEKELKNELKK